MVQLMNTSQPPEKKWKHEDNEALRKLVGEMLPITIAEVLGHKITFRVLSSYINHTKLEPSGATFTINFVIQTNRKKDQEQ
jgi:hypothetical protein